MPQKEPFKISVPDAVLEDLRERLGRTRWPRDFGNENWEYGTKTEDLKELVDYWRTSYDWRKHEREMNSFANYKTEIEGIPDPFHPRARQGAESDPAYPEPWMALDLLGFSQGHQAAGRSSVVWRRSGRCVRRGGTVATGVRVLDAPADDRNQLLEDGRSLGQVDAGRARL